MSAVMERSEAIRRPLTGAMLDEAQDAAMRVCAALPSDQDYGNYTGLAQPDRFRVGYIGEILVREWLKESGKWFEHRVVTDGKSQGAEFVVASVFSGERWLLEVKTASQERYTRFMMPEDQKMDFDIAIAVRLVEPKAYGEIMGVISRRNVLALPVDVFPPHTTPTRWKLYREMSGAARLLDLIEPETNPLPS